MGKIFGITAALFALASQLCFAQIATKHPLFKLLPSLEQRAPRIPILKKYTPVEKLSRLERELLVDEDKLWIKRDDDSSELLGGNKARKLEFLLGEAKATGARWLVTSGMYGSNHALATAIAGKRYGFNVSLILGPQPITDDVRQKLLAFRALGAEMRFHSNRISMGLDMLGATFTGRDVYNIPAGGSNVVGDLGYVNAYLELVEQLGREGLPERIVVPVGSMGTAAGLLVGSCLAGTFENVQIVGVSVADPLLTNEITLRKQAIRVYNFIRNNASAADRAKIPYCKFMSSDHSLKYIEDQYAPGYGAAKKDVYDAIALLKKSEGIQTEITYSGKALAYLIGDLQRAVVQDRRIPKTLFWLTYNSHELAPIIDSFSWTNPRAKWLDLPKDFQRFY